MPRTIVLPDSSHMAVPDGVSDSQAYQIAKQYYPDSFPQINDIAPTAVVEKKPQGGIFSDLFSAGAKGAKQMVSQSRTGIASLFGNPEEQALAGLERSKALEEQYKDVRGTDVEKIKAPWERGEYGKAALEAASQSPYAIAENLPQIAGMGLGTIAGGTIGTLLGPAGTAAGAVAGRALGATIGARIGEWITSAAQQRGSNVERQAQEQIQKGEQVNIDSWKASTAAAGQGALDVLSFHMLGGAKIVGKILGKTEAEILKMPAATAEKLVQESFAKTAVKGLGTGFLAEIPNELGQTMLERWQAGLDLTSPEALKEYGDTAIAVGLLAPLGAAGRFSEKSTARGVIKREESLTQFDRNLTGLIDQSIASGQYPSRSDAYYSAIDQAKKAVDIGAHMTVYDSVGNEAPAVVTGRTEEGIPLIQVATAGSDQNYVLGQEFDLVNPDVMEARLSDGTSVETLAKLPGEDLNARLEQLKQTVEENRLEQAKGNDLVQYHIAERDLATLVSAITNPEFVSLNKKVVGANEAIAKEAIKLARQEKKKQDAAQTPLTKVVESPVATVAAPATTTIEPPVATVAAPVATVAAPVATVAAPVEIVEPPIVAPVVAPVKPYTSINPSPGNEYAKYSFQDENGVHYNVSSDGDVHVKLPANLASQFDNQNTIIFRNGDSRSNVYPSNNLPSFVPPSIQAAIAAHVAGKGLGGKGLEGIKKAVAEAKNQQQAPAFIAAQPVEGELTEEEKAAIQAELDAENAVVAAPAGVTTEVTLTPKRRVRRAAPQTATAYLLQLGGLAPTFTGTDLRTDIYGDKKGINQRLFSGTLPLDTAARMLRDAGWDISEEDEIGDIKRILLDEANGIKHYAAKDQEEVFKREADRRAKNQQAAAEAEAIRERNRPLLDEDEAETTITLPGDEDIPFSKTAGKRKAVNKARTEAQKLVATIKEERLNKRYQDALPRVAALIEKRMKQLGLAKFINVEKLKSISVVGPDGKLSMEGKVNGAFLKTVIQLAVAGKSDAQIMSTLNHEAIHAMRELGMITETEWTNLSKVVENKGWINLFQVRERYDEKSMPDQEGLIEEAIADAFSTYATGRSPIISYLDKEQTKPVYVYKAQLKLGGQPVGIITRIIKMLKGIRDVTDEDVFKRIQEAPIAPTAVAVTPTAVAATKPKKASKEQVKSGMNAPLISGTDIEESLDGYLDPQSETLREDYVQNNKGMVKWMNAAKADEGYQDALQQNLKRLGFPEVFIGYRGHPSDAPSPASYANITTNRKYAESFKGAYVNYPSDLKWVVDEVKVRREDVVALGHTDENELIVNLRPDALFKENKKPKLSIAVPKTEAFKRWFGDSKVVDGDGKPLVAYHGTTSSFNVFETKQVQLGKPRRKTNAGELGSWFAAPSITEYDEGNAEYVASSFTEDNSPSAGLNDYKSGANVMPVYLSIKKPYDAGDYESLMDDRDEYGSWKALRKQLEGEGYDGIVIYGSDTDGNVIRDDWVAFNPAQIKSATGNRGTFDENNPDIRYSKTPEFKRWTHGNQIINLNEKHKFADGVPVVVQVVHGTTGDYEYFDRSKLNQESDLGAGFYFTNSLADANANYAGMGPDLTNKIDLTAERIASETDREYNDPDVIEEARKQFLANEGQVMPVYVRFDNPVVLGGKKETFFDLDQNYDEKTEEYGEPTGKFVDFIEAFKLVAENERYGSVDVDKVVGDLYDKAADNDGLSASDLIKTAKESDGLTYAEDNENGELASTEIIRQAFEEMGYDGFIDQTVLNKFSRYKNIKGNVVQKPMKGVTEDTVHFIAFKQKQIKSSVGNLGSYGERPLTKDELEQEGITAAEAEKRQNLGYIRYSSTAKKLTPKERKEEVRRILAAFENNLLPEERKKLTLATAQKLVNLIKELPSANELTSVALAGIVKRGWYRHSAEAIANVFGGDGPRFTALLAATSPQTSVESNLRNALNIWKNWTLSGRPSDPRLALAVNKGGVALALADKVYDKALKKTVSISRDEARKILADRGFPMELYGMAREQLKIMGESVEGNRGEASVLDAWIGNSMRALNAEDSVSQVLSGPKVNSFYRNLIGFVNEVTNDAWMANFAGVDQKIFAGGLNAKATEPGKGFGYMAMNVQVRKAANLLTKMTNDIWTPSEVQETIWSWAKTALELASEVGRPVQVLVRDKSITDDLINATPDFRTLFHAPEYQAILEGAGYAEQLRKLVAPSRDNGLAAQKKSSVGSEAEEITPNPRHLIEAARRLETLRQKRITEKAETVARNKLSVAKYSGAKTTPATRIFGGSQIAPVWAMPNTTPSSEKIDNLRFLFQDRFLDLDKLIQAVKATGIQISDQFNAYLKETLFHGRVAEQSLEFTRKEIDPLLQDMKARGVSIGDIEKYLHNRHAEERNNYIATINTSFPDGGSGIKTQDARNYLNGLSPTQRANYIAIAAKVDAMMKKTNDLRVSSGLAEQGLVDAWNNTYKHYVPLQRDMKDNKDETNQRSIGQGFSVSERMKRAMGSTYDVENILSNIVAERERIIVKAEKNNVTKSIFNLALKAPNSDFWLAVDIEKDKNALKNLTSLLNMGLSVTEATNIAAEPMTRQTDPATGHVVTRLNPTLRRADNVLHVMIDGKEKILIFNTKSKEANRLVRTLKNLDMQNMGYVMGSVANITRYFASVNTQYNPIFGVINFMRDVQTGLLNLTNTPIANKKSQVLADTFPALRGIWDQIRKDANGQASTNSWGILYKEFEKAGGPTGYREMFTTSEDRADALAKEFKRLSEGKVKAGGRAIFNALSDYNTAMENAVRLAAYKAAKDSGLSIPQAAYLAKNLTVNFNKKGDLTREMGALYAFFNASVQGTARIAQTLAGPAGRKIIGGGLLLGSMQAMLLAASGFGDDEPPDFIKEKNIVIPTGDGKYITIPMPLGFNLIPNTSRVLTEIMLEERPNLPKKLAGLFSATFSALAPTGGGPVVQMLTPTIADPIVALAQNKDAFGRRIYKEDFSGSKPTAGYLRTKETATPWAKGLAEFLNYASGGTQFKQGIFSPTPDQIDYLIGQATGGVGREASKFAQTFTSLSTGEELPSYKVPLVSRFFGDTKETAAEANKFYENLKRLNEHGAELDGYRKNPGAGNVGEYLKENPEARLVAMARHTQEMLSNINKQKRLAIQRELPKERVKQLEELARVQMHRLNERVEALR